MTTILDEAAQLVYGDREARYGPPGESLARAGRMWAAVLGLEEVTATQVCLCMAALKLSRLAHSVDRDSITDLAGYAALIERVSE